MEITNALKIKTLQKASICYIIAGLGFLLFSFPFWFLNAVDSPPKGQKILPFLFLIDNPFSLGFKLWIPLISSIAMLIGAFSLYKIAEPTGFGTKRNFLIVSIVAAISYILGQFIPLPFAPLGALLSGLGMILVGIASLKTRIWGDWKRFAPLIVGCFPFLFMFPLLIITGHRPVTIIGFWGFPWLLLGIAIWLRSKEVIE